MKVRVTRYGKNKIRVKTFTEVADWINYLEASYFMMKAGFVQKIQIERRDNNGNI